MNMEVENKADNAGLTDAELFAEAKKCWSWSNFQPLEVMCMKEILKKFDRISTMLEYLAPPMKTSFLDFILKLSKQGKTIPLSVEQRVILIKLLLHKSLDHFDFNVVIAPQESHEYFDERSFLTWNKVFDDLWIELAAKCPNLLTIRERRPVGIIDATLNFKVFTFSELLCLDTNCCINADSIREMVQNLKHLQQLKACYEPGTVSNITELRQLKHLQELHLDPRFSNLDSVMKDFNETFYLVLPNLKVYNKVDFEWTDPRNEFRKVGAFDKLAPCAVEECRVTVVQDSEIRRLASNMPNLRRLTIDLRRENIMNYQLLLSFKNLTSLQVMASAQTIPILTLIGPKLKELSMTIYSEISNLPDVLKVFTLCPNLEYLILLWFQGIVDWGIPVNVADWKLKKLAVGGNFHNDDGFLPLLFSAPLLEEVQLSFPGCSILITKDCFETLIAQLSQRLLLQNVSTFELGQKVSFLKQSNNVYRRISEAETRGLLKILAKNIASFCPKLETACFNFKLYYRKRAAPWILKHHRGVSPTSSVVPFLNLVKRL